MSGLRGPWKMLDLAPTENLRSIRRAYAVRLKAIDPDTDPQAFRALREAFEQAQREAEWIGREDEEEDWTPDLADTKNEEAPLGEELKPTPAPASPWAPPAPADVDAHARALAELLLGDHADRWPSAEEEEAMQRHWAAISTDPRMEQMSFFADVEQWAAGLIARSAPFSNPLVRPVTRRFGWMETAGQIHQSPAVAYVVERCRMLGFFEALQDKRHELHRAYVELSTPAGDNSRRGWVSASNVQRLLWTVRKYFPELEGNFDAYRVSMWENPQGFASRLPTWVSVAMMLAGAAVIIVFLALASPKSDLPSRRLPELAAAPGTLLTEERADNERALEVLFSGAMPLAKVETINPELQALLHDQWMEAKRFRFRFDAYVGTLRAALAARYAQVRFDAPFQLLVEMRQIELAVLKSLRSRGPEACARTLGGDFTDDELTVDQLMQRRALMIRILLDTQTGGKVPQSRGFTLSGAEVERIAQQAGLHPERFSRALRREGQDSEMCAARIAMLEAGLAMPRKKGEAVLRGL